jgi:hypothetical protein
MVAGRRVGAPFSPPPSVSGGSQSATVARDRGEPSSVTGTTGSPVSRPAVTSGSDTVADAGTNVGRGAVVLGQPAQPAQHLRDVRAEDAAVVVALVDDDEAQARPGSAPTAHARAASCGAAGPGW